MYQPSQLCAFLERLHIVPNSALSQNFLIDGNTLERIFSSSSCPPNSLVLEIGAGPGALTECLLKHGMRVLAVEKDRLFAEELPRLDKEGKLTVFAADALQLPLKEILQQARGSSEHKAYVIANLPYHLTTPLLLRLLPLHQEVHSLTLMVQKEMAERLVAPVKTTRYGWLAPYARFFGTAKVLFSVKKQLFYPQPKVDSVVIQVLLQEPVFEGTRKAHFLAFLLSAFSQPRKMVRNRWHLSCAKEQVEAALCRVQCSPTARPEEIAYEQWLQLFELLEEVLDFDQLPPFRHEGGL